MALGIALDLENLDELFYTFAHNQPFIINDVNEDSQEDKEVFNRRIYTKYRADDLLSNLPSCECGEITGRHNVGVVCRNCNTAVSSPLEQTLEPLVWIRRPQGVRQLINPIVWTMLNERFKRGPFEVIRWLCDTTYKYDGKIPPFMQAVHDMNIPRGYNNFVDNFDSILDSLFSLKVFKSKERHDALRILLKEKRDCVFSDHLPIPNRALLVLEESNVGNYVDPITTGAVDAIFIFRGIDSELAGHSVRTKENRTVKTIAALSEFYDGVNRTTLAKKEGIFRKHVFGSRAHFTFRAVITSLTGPHDYDELHIPWGIGVSVFREHLRAKLFRRGYTPTQALAFLNEHAQKFHPLLDELFEELITESPYKGIPVIFQRNPSLERGSAQALFITKVKKDPSIPTVSLSILIVVGFNADKRKQNPIHYLCHSQRRRNAIHR